MKKSNLFVLLLVTLYTANFYACHKNLSANETSFASFIDDTDSHNSRELYLFARQILNRHALRQIYNNDSATKDLSDFYDTQVSLGHEYTNHEKNNFIREGRSMIAAARANPAHFKLWKLKSMISKTQSQETKDFLIKKHAEEFAEIKALTEKDFLYNRIKSSFVTMRKERLQFHINFSAF